MSGFTKQHWQNLKDKGLFSQYSDYEHWKSRDIEEGEEDYWAKRVKAKEIREETESEAQERLRDIKEKNEPIDLREIPF